MMFRMCFWDRMSVQPMKSSTKTSSKDMVLVRSSIGKVVKFVGSILDSKGCGGRSVPRREAMTSLAVSDAAQKNGGDSHHPIWRLLGTSSSHLAVRLDPHLGDSNRNSMRRHR